MLFITLSTLLKTGFHPWWGILITALLYALFTLYIGSWATEQSKAVLNNYLISRPAMLNASIGITSEAVAMTAFCFDCFPGMRSRPTFFKQAVSLFLHIYPGFLFAGVICIALMQSFYKIAGVDFQTIINTMALTVFALISGGAIGFRLLLKEKSLRLEMLFIASLSIILLGIIITGN
ncbi:MAG: hypothetical protein LBL58_12275 [Tannerellaceae bacterium]|nr:hypothetical protein [Tannerellaceae bacterium]